MDGDGEAWELMLRSGCCTQPWLVVRPVVTTRLARSVEEFDKTSPAHCVDAQERVARLVAMLKEFDEAPFTLQRLCELIAEPHRFFRASFYYYRALRAARVRVFISSQRMQALPTRSYSVSTSCAR